MLNVLREPHISEPESDAMRLRQHDAVITRTDFFMVDPRELKIDPSYNVREMDSPETIEHIAGLKATIADSGVRTPLEVRLDGDDVYVVAGHCRLAAVMQLIAEGRDDIKAVPAVPEPSGTSEIERTLNLHLSNTTNPLSPLAKAKIVKRLQDFGWKDSEIARRMGWKSTNSVKDSLDLLAMPEEVKQQVKQGDVSANTARKEVKRSRSEAAANIRKAKEEQKAKGKTKATPKAIKAVRTPAAAVPTPETPAEMPMPEQRTATIEPADTMTEQQLIDGLAAQGYRVTKDDGAAPEAALPIPPREYDAAPGAALARELSAPRHAVKEIFDAAAPIAIAITLTDLNEIADDAVVTFEIFGHEAKRFSSVYLRQTGGADAS